MSNRRFIAWVVGGALSSLAAIALGVVLARKPPVQPSAMSTGSPVEVAVRAVAQHVVAAEAAPLVHPRREASQRSATPPADEVPQATAPKWYEGGTLHDRSALEWQEAEYHDKLATCGDFVAVLWRDKKLKPSIQRSITSIDDMKPYAVELMACLDAATEKHPDSQKNSFMYANQPVSGLATACTVLSGWVD